MRLAPASLPGLPSAPPFAAPLRRARDRVHGELMCRVLNRVFAEYLADGELDFLEGHSVRIQVDNAPFSLGLCMRDGVLVADAAAKPDLTVSGSAYDYLLLVTDREDADTLFFQRRLSMEGSTDLGVHLKNFLAAIDHDSLPLPRQFRPALQRLANVLGRFA